MDLDFLRVAGRALLHEERDDNDSYQNNNGNHIHPHSSFSCDYSWIESKHGFLKFGELELAGLYLTYQ